MEFVGRELAGSDAGKVFSGLQGVMFVIGSDEMTCMPPYLRAAISCADRGRDFRRSFCRRFWNQIWTSFSFNETRWTISRRACLSGLALSLYASSSIILSLAAVRFRLPLGCFSVSEPGRGLAAASASGGRICDVKDSS